MDHAFYQPLDGLVATSPHFRRCPEHIDEDWLRLGIVRVLEQVGSGRAFLQGHGPGSGYPPSRANYFEALASGRRRDLAVDLDRGCSPPWAAIPTGWPTSRNWRATTASPWTPIGKGAAAHDARHEGAKRADGHFYSYGTGLANFENGFVRGLKG